MNEYFGTTYSQEDLQRRRHSVRDGSNQGNSSGNGNRQFQDMAMGAIPGQANSGMNMNNNMIGGESLNEMMLQNNNQAIHRQRTLNRTYSEQMLDRRTNSMEFGQNSPNVSNFQFGTPVMAPNSLLRRQSHGASSIDTMYANMASSMGMGNQNMAFQQSPTAMNMNTSPQFDGLSSNMMPNMMDFNAMSMEDLDDQNNINTMFSSDGFSFNDNVAMQANFLASQGMSNINSIGHNNQNQGIQSMENRDMPGLDSTSNQNMISSLSMNDKASDSPTQPATISSLNSYNSTASADPPVPNLSRESTTSQPRSVSQSAIPRQDPATSVDPPKGEQYQGIYSQSGFDMLGALMKVATRKNPEIEIGKVDLSCAFVVCDMSKDDCPIIYVSDIFERLTGYTRFEVIGRNCRFLQSPDGKVTPGVQREFVDNDSVYYLKRRIAQKKEAQRSLINYRKGGQPFMNLLTMIPITGEDNKELRYIVGFQVDLVEKPTSVEGKNANGLYTVDYSQDRLPRYVWQPPEVSRGFDGGQTVSRDDVSTVLSSINSNNADSELTKRLWDKVLLENTDDVVHVLSLKGLFLYLSPSSRRVLEYDASELVGTALSSVCHPSDIVPVTRELKDTTPGSSVNVVFRIRRKKSGYTWFESHGSLCVEQGKGRKCIILVGRERPVYALQRNEIDDAGGIGEAEIWTKLSTSGMFLYVSSNIRNLLDRSPDDLVGTSLQALMRVESREAFGRALERARTGYKAVHKHEISNKRGLVMQAQTTLYPGDASEGQKPTFLVAQTRLLKPSRSTVSNSHASRTSGTASTARSPSGDATPMSNPSVSSNAVSADVSGQQSQTTTHAGGNALAIGTQDEALAHEQNIFDELKTTRSTSWQFELRQMEKSNRLLAEELAALVSNKKKRKRRRPGHVQRDCANCHTRTTPEWRRGPSGQRDLCNSCGLRYAKQVSGQPNYLFYQVQSLTYTSSRLAVSHRAPLGRATLPKVQRIGRALLRRQLIPLSIVSSAICLMVVGLRI